LQRLTEFWEQGSNLVNGELSMPFFKARKQIVRIIAMGLIVSFILGCSSKVEEPQRGRLTPELSSRASDGDNSTDYQLQAKLFGKWESLAGHWKGSVIGFSQEGSLHLELKGPYDKRPEDQYGRFSALGRTFEIGPEMGPWNTYKPEFTTEDEMLLLHVSGKTYRGFGLLEGRWKRITPQQSTGPIAEAQRQVEMIEQKVAKLESVLQTTLADRDELASKLRSVGVNSPTDLKINVRGRRLAEDAVTLAKEIEELELQLADIDSELLKAKSIVRRMEREQAELTAQEMESLALQLRQAEERTDATPLPVTPLDVDAAVEKALYGSAGQATPKQSK